VGIKHRFFGNGEKYTSQLKYKAMFASCDHHFPTQLSKTKEKLKLAYCTSNICVSKSFSYLLVVTLCGYKPLREKEGFITEILFCRFQVAMALQCGD